MYFIQITESVTTEEVTSKAQYTSSYDSSSAVKKNHVWLVEGDTDNVSKPEGRAFVNFNYGNEIAKSWRGAGEVVELLLGLTPSIAESMEVSLMTSKINYSRREPDCIEAETSGLKILNILDLNYRVYGQSMAIEESFIGGRTIKVQKTIWTVGKK